MSHDEEPQQPASLPCGRGLVFRFPPRVTRYMKPYREASGESFLGRSADLMIDAVAAILAAEPALAPKLLGPLARVTGQAAAAARDEGMTVEEIRTAGSRE